jgi:hypothetical protein
MIFCIKCGIPDFGSADLGFYLNRLTIKRKRFSAFIFMVLAETDTQLDALSVLYLLGKAGFGTALIKPLAV